MQMRAARMYDYNQPLRLEEISVPNIGPSDVLVKVAATGMCRSDVQLMEGDFPLSTAFPIVPRHEVAGQIVAVGADVPPTAGLSEATWSWSTRTGVTGHVGSVVKATNRYAATGRWRGSGPRAAMRSSCPFRTAT